MRMRAVVHSGLRFSPQLVNLRRLKGSVPAHRLEYSHAVPIPASKMGNDKHAAAQGTEKLSPADFRIYNRCAEHMEHFVSDFAGKGATNAH